MAKLEIIEEGKSTVKVKNNKGTVIELGKKAFDKLKVDNNTPNVQEAETSQAETENIQENEPSPETTEQNEAVSEVEISKTENKLKDIEVVKKTTLDTTDMQVLEQKDDGYAFNKLKAQFDKDNIILTYKTGNKIGKVVEIRNYSKNYTALELLNKLSDDRMTNDIILKIYKIFDYDFGYTNKIIKDVEKLSETAPQELTTPAKSGIIKLTGNKGTAFTNDNTPIEFQYAVISADDLITSNNADGSINTAYPQELQPRDRTRVSFLHRK